MDDANDQSPDVCRTELDSHANMPVVGKGVYVLAHTGRNASVSPYNPDYASMLVSTYQHELKLLNRIKARQGLSI